MKRILPLILILIAGSAWAIPPSPPFSIATHNTDATAHPSLDHYTDTTAVHGQDDMDNPSFDSVTIGDPISAVDTEYPVWEAVDSNGDVVASATVECSVLTDGSQVCQIHYYVMSDTAGTLTEEFTIDVDSD